MSVQPISAQPVSGQPISAPPADEPEPEPATAVIPPPPPEPELEPAVQEAINMVVQSLAETLLGSLTPELWPIAMRRLEQLISPDA